MSDLARMLLNLCVLYAAARLAGALFVRFRQPAVVGEILAGVVVGPHVLNLLHYSPAIRSFNDLFAHLGVVFLLFIVGLQTEPRSLWKVGRESAAVGALGVVFPFGLGYFLMRSLNFPINESLFLATALTATSVGITARVLADLHRIATRVGNVIMGAAVFDDILGMLLLAVVSSVTLGLPGNHLLVLLAETAAFVLLAIFLGRPAVHHLAPRMGEAEEFGHGPLFALAVTVCLAFSALAEIIGLAAIVGAFFAGIIFAETEGADELRLSMRPIYHLLVPIFFVLMGAQVDLPAFSNWPLLVLALLVTLVGVVGKLFGCGLGALPLGKREALSVGVGMIPRGEVGLVVASLGLSRGVISPPLYSVIIFMCLLSSVLAPPLLRRSFIEEA